MKIGASWRRGSATAGRRSGGVDQVPASIRPPAVIAG
jgi:hypothetical protein